MSVCIVCGQRALCELCRGVPDAWFPCALCEGTLHAHPRRERDRARRVLIDAVRNRLGHYDVFHRVECLRDDECDCARRARRMRFNTAYFDALVLRVVWRKGLVGGMRGRMLLIRGTSASARASFRDLSMRDAFDAQDGVS